MPNYDYSDENEWPKEMLQNEIRTTQHPEHAITAMMVNELRRRNERDLAAQTHKDLMEQNAALHTAAMTQIGAVIGEMRTATKVARWAVCISFVAAITAAVLPLSLESCFTKYRRASKEAQSAAISQPAAIPTTSGKSGLSNVQTAISNTNK